ncbi:hypothetical protein OPIT5_04110 [Opitutaceae bacterium TAV5]|nr:hypothetical protein OPIT5_04110 [Opitutaceae bacterium TAV5]
MWGHMPSSTLWPEVLENALNAGKVRAGDVFHYPPEAHAMEWGKALEILKFTAIVTLASDASKDSDGVVHYTLYHPVLDKVQEASRSELNQLSFRDLLRRGTLV